MTLSMSLLDNFLACSCNLPILYGGAAQHSVNATDGHGIFFYELGQRDYDLGTMLDKNYEKDG